jgi:hypothetical protein
MSETMNPALQRPLRTDTGPILDLVRRTGEAVRRHRLRTGLCLSAAFLFGVAAAATGVDLAAPLPRALRLVALLALIGPATAVLVARVVWPLRHPPTPTQLAYRMERLLPGIHNRLVSCVDLASNGGARELSPAFAGRLIGETCERVRGFRPETVVDARELRRARGLAGGALLLVLALAAAFPGRMPTAVARLLAPLADIPPASGVAYAVTPGNTAILRGDDMDVIVRVWKGRPDRLRLEMADEDGGRPLRYDLEETGHGRWSFRLTGFQRSFRYRIVGGGTWSPRYRTTVLERPMIVDLRARLRYPSYLGMTNAPAGTPQTADVAGPRGSDVEVIAEVRGDVRSGEILHGEPATNGAPDIRFPPILARFPMRGLGENRWSGTFPLLTNGFYRVEFRDPLGHANKPLTPSRFTALADNPPMVTLERPGADLVLSVTGKVPVVVAASDDYGLADVSLVAAPRGNTNLALRLPVKSYPTPQANDATVSVLDLGPMRLTVGEYVLYHAEARDSKGQRAVSRAFTIRIAAGDQAMDRQAEKFGQTQDAFLRQLQELIAAQAAVPLALSAMATNFAPVVERLDKAAAEVRPAPQTLAAGEPAAASNRFDLVTALGLDADSEASLAALQKQLGELATLQQKNADAARRFAADWDKASEQGSRLPLVPLELTDQMRLLEQSFGQMVVAPMQGLAAAMRDAASPEHIPGGTEFMGRQADLIGRGLEDVRRSLDELGDASRQLREDPAEAVAQLRSDRLRSQAGLVAHRLRGLQDLLSDVLKEMKTLESRQAQIQEAVAAAPEAGLDKLETEQAELDADVRPLLNFVGELQTGDRIRRLRRPAPEFPSAPYTPEQDAYAVPPAEPDTPEPLTEEERRQLASGEQAAAGTRAEEEREEPERLYMPALGGPPAKLDPRFADKVRPVEKDPRRAAAAGPSEPREEISRRQWSRLQELQVAQQSVGSDQQTLANTVQQLEQAVADSLAPAESASPSPQDLRQVMQSEPVERAVSMAAQVQAMQGRGAMSGLQRTWSGMMRWFRSWGGGGFGSGFRSNAALGADSLPNLDVQARTVIMAMQPRLREELLQGMQEEGPEAYRRYIQDYFDHLTKVKNP